MKFESSINRKLYFEKIDLKLKLSERTQISCKNRGANARIKDKLGLNLFLEGLVTFCFTESSLFS